MYDLFDEGIRCRISLRNYLAELSTQQGLEGKDDGLRIKRELYNRSSKSRDILRMFLFLTISSSDPSPVL